MVASYRAASMKFVVFFCIVAGGPVAGAASTEAQRAQEIVEAHLARFQNAAKGKLLDVNEESLTKSFPGCAFFVLRFPQFPVEVAVEPPLKPNNVFVVCDGKVTHLTDERELEEFFRHQLSVSTTADAGVNACKSWLRLAQELRQDGYFEFAQPVVKRAEDVSEGAIEVVAKGGNQGKLTVAMQFVGGRLAKVTAGGKVVPGIRPRCQGSRLLDPDPVLREIMRRDILVMGSACRSYLDQVRADASPELKQAIDDIWRQIVDENR
jgi:hypothetical protein